MKNLIEYLITVLKQHKFYLSSLFLINFLLQQTIKKFLAIFESKQSAEKFLFNSFVEVFTTATLSDRTTTTAILRMVQNRKFWFQDYFEVTLTLLSNCFLFLPHLFKVSRKFFFILQNHHLLLFLLFS